MAVVHSRQGQGPNTELWRQAVCMGSIPPLQPGEHMTVGQVRHPALQSLYYQEFKKWFLNVKKASKSWTKQKVSNPALMHLLSFTPMGLTNEGKATAKRMLAAALGWEHIRCEQLKTMLQACDTPDQALALLLSNSRKPVTLAQQQPTTSRRSKKIIGLESDSDSDNHSDASYHEDDCGVDPDLQQQHSWFALPQDLAVQGVVAGKVPADDQRQALRGQHGVWATQDLEEGFVIGPYRHYALFSRAYDVLLHNPPASMGGARPRWQLLLESYASNDDSEKAKTLSAQQDSADGAACGSYSLTNSGYGYGNITAYVNDPHVDPVASMLRDDVPDDYLGPCITGPDGTERTGCARIQYASICGWPYPFMVVESSVPEGEEVLYDYGHSYWSIWYKVYRNYQEHQVQYA